MNTTSATPIPETNDQAAFDLKRQLWRLPVGTVFEDWYGKQRFEKVAEIINSRGQVRHAIQCLVSPFKAGQDIGRICSAFFTTPGTVLYREGDLQVFIQGERRDNACEA
jgi:hypothetical protein